MIIALICTTGAILLIILIGFYLSAPGYKGEPSDHFDGKRFVNPLNVQPKGLADVFKWAVTRKPTRWENLPDDQYGEKPEISIDSKIRITFVNHTTFLIQLHGLNILTDPIWSQRAGPFSWAGPKRKRLPGIRFEDLPTIHAILLSHNHYDHLDINSLKKLWEKFRPKIFTSLGAGEYLRKQGIESISELDWWQQIQINDALQLIAVPAQHFSGRGMFDRDSTLWLGFVITSEKGNIYFAGDTGYNSETFKQIGERCSPILVSLIPIGAYLPRWFMGPIHCSPGEAVKIHKEVKSKNSIGSHFGTFALADEGREEPVIDLKKALDELNVPQEQFIVLKEGTWKEY